MIVIKGRIISKKNSKQVFKVKGRTIVTSSKAYKAYEEAALWQLKSCKERYTGALHVDYTMNVKGKLDIDIDNAMASINDILQKAGVIDDDKNVMSVRAVKYRGCDDWSAIIKINQLPEEDE